MPTTLTYANLSRPKKEFRDNSLARLLLHYHSTYCVIATVNAPTMCGSYSLVGKFLGDPTAQ
eukprot:1186467-Prorocentrum_minimum.AAC.3